MMHSFIPLLSVLARNSSPRADLQENQVFGSLTSPEFFCGNPQSRWTEKEQEKEQSTSRAYFKLVLSRTVLVALI